jgi:hypothetical protein
MSHEAGYWQMYGIYLFVHVLDERLTVQEDARWRRVFMMLAAATPPDLVEGLKKALVSAER